MRNILFDSTKIPEILKHIRHLHLLADLLFELSYETLQINTYLDSEEDADEDDEIFEAYEQSTEKLAHDIAIFSAMFGHTIEKINQVGAVHILEPDQALKHKKILEKTSLNTEEFEYVTKPERPEFP